ncbi:MAG: response regulator, partial [Mameliella sp.]|nr:response regulator [Phaeodactylibacter sp.]
MNLPEEKVKILLVDDKPENLFSLEAILEGEDREIICAGSGNEALKLAIKNRFALILSDVQMPGMDGFEMVEILRSNPKNKHIPIIFVTAISKEEQYVYKGYNEGAVDYLFKPLDATIVRAKTEIFIALYKQQRQLESQKKELQLLNRQKNE